MKPVSREPPSTARALLEAGRKHPPLRYDVDTGLLRHHQHVQNGAPLPVWASSGGALPSPSLAWRIVKLLMAAAVVGPLVVALWPGQEPGVHVPKPAAKAAPVATPAIGPAPERAGAEAEVTASPAESRSPAAPVRRTRSRSPRERTQKQVTHEAAAGSELAIADVRAPSLDVVTTSRDAEPRTHQIPRTIASRPVPEAKESRDSDEVRELARAEHLLRHAPQRALELVRTGDARFPAGYLRQERSYVAIMALIQLGAAQQARVEAELFFTRYPDTPYGAQIRRALAQHPVDAGAR